MNLLQKFLSLVSTQVYAGCNPGSGSDFQIFDCLLLNSGGETVEQTYGDPATLVNTIVQNIFVVAGALMFVFIIYAGLKFLISPESAAKEDSKQIVEAVAVGFLVMFSAYWIIQIVEVIFGLGNII